MRSPKPTSMPAAVAVPPSFIVERGVQESKQLAKGMEHQLSKPDVVSQLEEEEELWSVERGIPQDTSSGDWNHLLLQPSAVKATPGPTFDDDLSITA
ncbi:hypothetical protein CB1_001515002 [Camelus ferus]|nr:hypothetical protein CB1_001515002 [Camelus ferus]